MSIQNRARSNGRKRRSVSLTPEAIELVRTAILEKWQREGTGRLTTEARAELLGLSHRTIEKMLNGSGVDRATLIIAFGRLDLPWQESFCLDPEFGAPEPMSEPEAVPPSEIAAPASPVEEPSKRVTFWPARTGFRLALGLLAGVATCAAVFTSQPKVDERNKYFLLTSEQSRNAYFSGDYALAEKLETQLLEVAKEVDSAGHIAERNRWMGLIKGARGDYPAAINHLKLALQIRKNLGQITTTYPLLESLGDMQTRSGDFRAAKISFDRALSGFEKTKDAVGVAEITRELGTWALRQGKLEEAERHLRRSLTVLADLEKPDIEADVLGRLAVVLAKQKRIPEAKKALDVSFNYWSAKNHDRWSGVIYSQSGIVEAEAGQLNKAADWFAKSVEAFGAAGDQMGRLESQRQLDSIRRALGTNRSGIVASRTIPESP